LEAFFYSESALVQGKSFWRGRLSFLFSPGTSFFFLTFRGAVALFYLRVVFADSLTPSLLPHLKAYAPEWAFSHLPPVCPAPLPGVCQPSPNPTAPEPPEPTPAGVLGFGCFQSFWWPLGDRFPVQSGRTIFRGNLPMEQLVGRGSPP